ncbi:MAG: hypothetical protein GOU99_00950 [Candidatus Altiarchaeota archaeon]|nr:hypothetical protein [Candidatus Altiarchaeota archaeon]
MNKLLAFLLAVSTVFAGVEISPNLVQMYVNETIVFSITAIGEGSIGQLYVTGPGLSFSKEMWAGPYGTETDIDYTAEQTGEFEIVAFFDDSNASASVTVLAAVGPDSFLQELDELRQTVSDEQKLSELDAIQEMYEQGKHDLARIQLDNFDSQQSQEETVVSRLPRILLIPIIVVLVAVLVLYFVQ